VLNDLRVLEFLPVLNLFGDELFGGETNRIWYHAEWMVRSPPFTFTLPFCFVETHLNSLQLIANYK